MARELRAGIRVPLRFAAVLMAAYAVSLPIPAVGLAFNVALMTAGIAATALALAFHPGAPSWISAIALAIALTLGLGASLAAAPLLSFACVMGAAAAIAVASPSRWRTHYPAGLAAMLGALSLILGGAAMMDEALAPTALFFAAALGLVTRALKAPVVIADARIERLVGAERA